VRLIIKTVSAVWAFEAMYITSITMFQSCTPSTCVASRTALRTAMSNFWPFVSSHLAYKKQEGPS